MTRSGPGSDPAPWDVGLQNERTRLAWSRTVLSGLACGLVVARLLAMASVTLAVLAGVSSLATATVIGAVSIRRFRRHGHALSAGRAVGDGRAPALAAVLLSGTALAALGYVFLV